MSFCISQLPTAKPCYHANGNITKDFDRDLYTIRNNLLNLRLCYPRFWERGWGKAIQFRNGNQIVNSYDASGRKLAARNFTNVVALSQPLNEGEVLKHVVDENERVYISSVHNIDNVEYNSLTTYNFSTASTVKSIQFSKLYNSEGYARDIFNPVTNPDYYYFCRDHLGNIREVWRGNRRTVVQRTQYYPSGLPWASNSSDNPSLQSRKYNGKEFVEMHGLDEYDSEARWYYPAIMRTTTIDPLAEKFYDISPYAWCLNNPVNAVDPDGKFAFLLPAIPYIYPVVHSAVIVGIAYFGAKTVSEVSVVIRENRSSNESRTDNATATTPQQRRHAREQEARSKQETADIKNKHQKMDSNYNANGDGKPKRDVENASIVTIIATGLGAAADLKKNIPEPVKPVPSRIEPFKTELAPKAPETIPIK